MAEDIAARAMPGQTLRTRDRRDAAITAVDAATGRISGTVPMVGACHWRRDGQYEGATSAGPLDLMPPGPVAPTGQKHASLQESFGDPTARNACCD
jgi:hypothetical protein